MNSQSEHKNRIILHIDMDYFFAACEEMEHPELKGKPVVICVYSGRTPDSGAVSTSNYEARKYGIKAGIPIRQAKKLKPDAIFLPIKIDSYRMISNEIMEILRDYADTLEQVSIDEAYLDISSRTADFDGAKRLALEIKDRIRKEKGLTCSIGIGPNKLIAKMASDFQKPDGLTTVSPDRVLDFLNPLNISRLVGVGKKTEQRLNEMGVDTIKDLSGLSAESLIHEFGGAKGLWLKNAATGIDESPVVEYVGSEQIGRITTLKEDTRDIDTISEIIGDLANEVYEKLKKRGLSYRSVTLVAITSDFRLHTKSKTLHARAIDRETIRATAVELLKTFLDENAMNLRRVGVRVSNFEKSRGQKTLLDFGAI